MSEQPRRPDNETHRPDPWEGRGKKPAPTPDQARKRREKWIMIGMIALAVVMAAAAAAVLFYNRWVKKPELPPPPSEPSQTVAPEQSLPPDETPEPTPTLEAVQPKVSGERKSEEFYTILVFGSDVTSGLTDTIMVVSYDITNQKATVMSIPRDTLVNVRTTYKSINGVYNMNGKGETGVAALKQEVSELIGFTPDYYVMIDWELVGEMVDAIGGVWYDIPYHMDYDDPYQDLFIHFDTGNQFLNGEDAMKVVRWRENNRWSPYYGEGGGSDITRLRNQQGFLKAVLKQTLQLQNLTKINQLAELFSSRVDSDLMAENMFWFGSRAIFGGLGVEDVNFVTMPHYGAGAYGSRYYGRVYPNQSELLTLINESLNPFVEEVTIRQLDLIRVSADGNTLSSSTGHLADPSAAIPPVVETDPPEESGPIESGEPTESDPVESSPPEASDPVPVETDSPPEESEPLPPDVPAGPGGDPDPAETGGETDTTDGDDTPGSTES